MNIAVRTAEGTDGPVILSAFCPTCATDAMPMDNGCCGFCDTRIVGDPKVKKRPAAKPRVTNVSIGEALRRETARLGRPPYSREWQAQNLRPSTKTIYRHYGTWDAALEAAGVLDGALTERGSAKSALAPDSPRERLSPVPPRSVNASPVASLERLLTDAGDLLDAIAVAKVAR